jgi:hypothetical protein
MTRRRSRRTYYCLETTQFDVHSRIRHSIKNVEARSGKETQFEAARRRGGQARVDGEVTEAESSGSRKARRGGVRTHPSRPEILIVLSLFFTIELSDVDFRACGSPAALADRISEFGQLPIPARLVLLVFISAIENMPDITRILSSPNIQQRNPH